MIRLFDIARESVGVAFNPEKLLWINQQHIIAAPADRIGEMLVPYLEEPGSTRRRARIPTLVAKASRAGRDAAAHGCQCPLLL